MSGATQPDRKPLSADSRLAGTESAITSKPDDVIAPQIVGQLNEAFLKRAELVQSDPDVLHCTVGANLAMTLTDLPRDQAIAAVVAASQNVKIERRIIQPAEGRAIDLIDVDLELVALLVTRAGAISLANHLLANLKGVAAQYNANRANSLAASVAQLTNGQSIYLPALARLEAQMSQCQFSANSPEFRATIIHDTSPPVRPDTSLRGGDDRWSRCHAFSRAFDLELRAAGHSMIKRRLWIDD